MPNKHFWQFKNAAKESAELYLYGDIADSTWYGDEVTPKQFAAELDAIDKDAEITVYINSGGGDVFAAQAIGNQLERRSGKVTAVIDGLCASAATIVACHCTTVKAAQDSTYMIHPVRMVLVGAMGTETLQKYIEALNACRDNILTLYARKTGRDKDELAELMDATSWWTGSQAKENGFIDEITETVAHPITENRDGTLFVNSVSMNMPFDKAPKFIQDRTAAAPAAETLVNRSSAGKPENTTKEETGMEITTVDELRTAYPDLVDQIEQAAAQNAADVERQRIRDIDDMCLPGSEAMANEAKYDKPMSAEDYAKQAIKNAKVQGIAYINAANSDADTSGANGIGGAANPAPSAGAGNDEFLDAIKNVNKR